MQGAACKGCGGAGEVDSGGILPWNEPAMIPCHCGAHPPSREAFEAAYAAEYCRARGVSDFTPSVLAGMRTGDTYGDRPYLNGQWKGWQACHASMSAQLAALAQPSQAAFDKQAIATKAERDARILAGGNAFNAAEFAVEKCQDQHDLIVGALRAEVERNKRTIAGMNEAHAKLAGLYEAAQARGAALERAEPWGPQDIIPLGEGSITGEAYRRGVESGRRMAARDWLKDALEWGEALNEAGWKFIHECPEDSATLFNNCKGPLRSALGVYFEKVAEQLGVPELRPEQPRLKVLSSPMPESNGKSNFTAILMREGGDICDGFTIARSEYPDRVRYEADCVRWLIGEIAERPFILDYDADKHSGYVAPATPASDELERHLQQEVDILRIQLDAANTKVVQLEGQCVQLAQAAQVPGDKISVSKEALRQVLAALVGPAHYIRELQVTREPSELFKNNPINVLLAEFNASAS